MRTISYGRANELSDKEGARLALLSFDYPPATGGISRLCGSIAEGLKDYGIWTITPRGGPKIGDKAASVPHRRPLRELSASLHLRRAKAWVLCSRWYPEGLLAVLFSSGKVAILAHGAELLVRSDRGRMFGWSRLRRWVMERAELVIANSRFTGGLVERCAPDAKIAVNPLAVDSGWFCPGNKREARRRLGLDAEFVIATVARLQPHKGHRTVIDAIASMEPVLRGGLVYLIVGSGPAENGLREYAARRGVGGLVRFVGQVADEDLVNVYRAADLFAMPSELDRATGAVEGFGLTFLEAQACGTLTVGSDIGGCPEAVGAPVGGWVIGEPRAKELERIIRWCLANPASVAEKGRNARRRVEEEYTWNAYIARLLGLLERGAN